MTREDVMNQIAKNVNACEKCRLCKTANKAVPGEGNIRAKFVFIGEAPGKNEDMTGKPFVGRAGALLDKLLGEIELKRSDIWIGNIIKHRPPDNRDPLPDEIAACKPYLEMQLKVIKPLLIVTLGRFAMNHFYPEGKISRDRGKLIKTGGFNVYPVYHPAAGLRNGNMMNAFREDFLRIPSVIEMIERGEVQKVKSYDSTEQEKSHEKSDDGQLGLKL